MAIGLRGRLSRDGLAALGSFENVFDLDTLQKSCAALKAGLRKHVSNTKYAGSCGEEGQAPKARRRPPPARNPSAQQTAVGLAAFAFIIFVTGAAPWALPRVFFAFLAVAMPWRFYDFVFRHRGYNLFYLFDFCYWVNAAVAWYLAGGAAGWDLPHLSAALYSLADGPVACALAAWRCRWTFGSADHTTSTLMHLLPGLAMFAHQHFGPGTETWAARLQRPAPAPALSWQKRSDLPALLGWRVAAPLLFYAAWQLHYWLVVQVGFARRIQARGHDTSFRCLSRRAKRAGNLLAAVVLHGSVARRVVVYGLLQAVFTLSTLALAQPSLTSFPVACAWQVAKFALPLWAACQHKAQAARHAAPPAQHRHAAQRRDGRGAPHRLAAPAS
ncbi:hypothetical protein ACKKBF_B02630 [Auxenochlorella protothecoides x Auxenochlorella symbiontica]